MGRERVHEKKSDTPLGEGASAYGPGWVQVREAAGDVVLSSAFLPPFPYPWHFCCKRCLSAEKVCFALGGRTQADLLLEAACPATGRTAGSMWWWERLA